MARKMYCVDCFHWDPGNEPDYCDIADNKDVDLFWQEVNKRPETHPVDAAKCPGFQLVSDHAEDEENCPECDDTNVGWNPVDKYMLCINCDHIW